MNSNNMTRPTGHFEPVEQNSLDRIRQIQAQQQQQQGDWHFDGAPEATQPATSKSTRKLTV